MKYTLGRDSLGVKTSLAERLKLDEIHSQKVFTSSENFLGREVWLR